MKPLLLSALVLLQPPAGPTYQGQPRQPHPFAPSLPLLTKDEEKTLNDIVDRFIDQDIGKLKGEAAGKAVTDFKALGPESVFVLVRGLNKSAAYESNCPAVHIARKINAIVATTKDRDLLDYLRDNIGAGVTAKRHKVTLQDLRLACSLRKAELQRADIAAKKAGGTAPAKLKWPATLTVDQLAAAVGKETGPALKSVMIELSTRQGDQVVLALGIATAREDKEIRALAARLLLEVLGNQSGSDLIFWLKKGEPNVRAAAAQTIGDKGHRLMHDLIAALEDSEETVRQAARYALVKLASNLADHGPQPGATPSQRRVAQELWRAYWEKK